MREVLGPGYIGCLVLAVVICMAGCVMPSRESLKEPGWNPTTGAGTTTDGGAGRAALIKPFIPPDRHGSPGVGAVSTDSGPRTDSASAAPQLSVSQEAAPVEAPLSVPLQPAARPVRWQEPSDEPMPGFQQPSAVPEASPVAPVRVRSVPDVATRAEGPDNSLATIETSPPPSFSHPAAPPAAQYRPGAQPAEPLRPSRFSMVTSAAVSVNRSKKVWRTMTMLVSSSIFSQFFPVGVLEDDLETAIIFKLQIPVFSTPREPSLPPWSRNCHSG